MSGFHEVSLPLALAIGASGRAGADDGCGAAGVRRGEPECAVGAVAAAMGSWRRGDADGGCA